MMAAYRKLVERVKVRDAVPVFPCGAYTPASLPVLDVRRLPSDSVLVDAVTWRCAPGLERAASFDDRGPRPDADPVVTAKDIKARARKQKRKGVA
jgi:hypothetical protein